MKIRILLPFAGFLALASVCLSAEPVLKDQFDGEADVGALLSAPRAVLLHSSEREAAARIAAMHEALLRAGLPDVPIVRVANLSALPFFVPRSAVIGSLKKSVSGVRLLLDWKGEVATRWALASGSVARVYAGGKLIAEAKLDAGGVADEAIFAAAAAAAR